jgi:hypothetical protein
MRHFTRGGVVHLELHTYDLAEVRAYLWQLLGWRSAEVGPPAVATSRFRSATG